MLVAGCFAESDNKTNAMKNVKHITFRSLTDADFFNINKPPGSEAGGGGQSYIDFPVRLIPVAGWGQFFSGIKSVRKSKVVQGPAWEATVHSIGVPGTVEAAQQIKIYQRRAASVSIARQKLHSKRANRVKAWHPQYGFPKPIDNTLRNQCPKGLMVYLVATFDGELWAGWYLNNGISAPPVVGDIEGTPLAALTAAVSAGEGHSQMLTFGEGELEIDTSNKFSPFVFGDPSEIEPDPTEDDQLQEEEDAESLFDQDGPSLENKSPEEQQRIITVRKRNKKIVRKLKKLYNHECQITGIEHTFLKPNGHYYTEAHHLIPLGDGGYDAPENLVILSPMLHRMLHYADVTRMDLNQIERHEDGTASLEIIINQKTYKIFWHRKHAELFRD